jgi:hypothetical protein
VQVPQPVSGRDEMFVALQNWVEKGKATETIQVTSGNSSVSLPQQVRLYSVEGLSRDTVSKWFGKDPRLPDLQSTQPLPRESIRLPPVATVRADTLRRPIGRPGDCTPPPRNCRLGTSQRYRGASALHARRLGETNSRDLGTRAARDRGSRVAHPGASPPRRQSRAGPREQTQGRLCEYEISVAGFVNPIPLRELLLGHHLISAVKDIGKDIGPVSK